MLTMDEIKALNELKDAIVDLKQMIVKGRGDSSSRASATVQSSAPMWVCVVMVALLLGYSFAKDGDKENVIVQQQAQILRLERKIDRIEDYQLTTYMLVPDLRKQVEKKTNKQEK